MHSTCFNSKILLAVCRSIIEAEDLVQVLTQEERQAEAGSEAGRRGGGRCGPIQSLGWVSCLAVGRPAFVIKVTQHRVSAHAS